MIFLTQSVKEEEDEDGGSLEDECDCVDAETSKALALSPV